MEAELKFERENIDGIAVVGTYLIDAARRLGVEFPAECGRLALNDACAVTVKSGAESLSAPTKAEIELLSEERRAGGERLACQAKIVGEGSIVILTPERKKDETPEDPNDKYRREFEEQPLEQKIANLVRLESIALSETFSFIINSPYHIVGKVFDVLAEFGLKMDADGKTAAQPGEHRTEEEKDAKAAKGKKTKKTPKSDDTVVAAEIPNEQ